MRAKLSTPELEAFVDDQVRQGRFASADEMVEAGLARLMLDPQPAPLDNVDLAQINRARAEYAAGDHRPLKDVAAELRGKYGLSRG